jgi:hypothetical protein
MATGQVTSLLVGDFHLGKKILQTKLQQPPAKSRSIQLLELKASAAKPISQPPQNIIKSVRRKFGIIFESYYDIGNKKCYSSYKLLQNN